MQKHKRRNYLINRSLQLRYMAMVGILMILLSISIGWVIYYTTWSMLLDRLQGMSTLDNLIIDTSRLILTRTSYLALAGVCLGALVTMFILHRIAGPLFRVEHVMQQIASGITPRTITFRKKDELKSLATAIDKAIDKIDEVSQKTRNIIEDASASVEKLNGLLAPEKSDITKAREELEHLRERLQEFETFRKEGE